MKKEVTYGLAGIILVLISLIFDKEIILFVSSLRNFYLDYLLISVTFMSQAVIIFFFLTSLFLWQEHKRKWILPLWLTLAFSTIIGYTLKVLIHRPRPFQIGLVNVLGIAVYLMKESYLIWNFSFPSFHSLLAFSAVPILNKEFPKFKYVWFVFASLVAFSRVYFGLHYMSDVIFGAVLGFILGMQFIVIEERYQFGERIMKKFKIKK